MHAQRWRSTSRFALCLCVSQGLTIGGSFDTQFEIIKKTCSRQQLYALLYDLPKGGDLHNHLGLSFPAEQWYAAATDKQRTHGNEFYTRIRFNNCPDSSEALIRFRTIQRSSYLALPDCRKAEYENLAALSPDLRQQWISAMKLDRAGEGRNEFFEAIVPRLAEMAHDPWLLTDLMVEAMKRDSAQGLRYLETQAGVSVLRDQDG